MKQCRRISIKICIIQKSRRTFQLPIVLFNHSFLEDASPWRTCQGHSSNIRLLILSKASCQNRTRGRLCHALHIYQVLKKFRRLHILPLTLNFSQVGFKLLSCFLTFNKNVHLFLAFKLVFIIHLLACFENIFFKCKYIVLFWAKIASIPGTR